MSRNPEQPMPMITAEQFIKPCGCREAGCGHNSMVEFEVLDALVDAFGAKMKEKLRAKVFQRRQGWDDRECEAGIRSALAEHCARGAGQEIDAANPAAMLWNFQQP
jgi:hypothetical protein